VVSLAEVDFWDSAVAASKEEEVAAAAGKIGACLCFAASWGFLLLSRIGLRKQAVCTNNLLLPLTSAFVFLSNLD